MDKNKPFDDRFMAFAVSVLKILPMLPKDRTGVHIGDQLFRSATSVGSHLQESRAAESKADFIHKMSMALKEMREARYWLTLATLSGVLASEEAHHLVKETGELVAILSQSVITAKAKMKHLKPQTEHVSP